MFELLNLPLEIQLTIFNKCESIHLKNLACTSKCLNEALRQTLWHNLVIPWTSLLAVDWRLKVERRRLANMRYTQKLAFDHATVRLLKHDQHKLMKTFQKVVSHCDPGKVNILHLKDRQIVGSIEYACGLFKALREVDLFGARLGGVAFRSLSQLLSLEVLNLGRTNTEEEQLVLIANNLKKLQKLGLNSNNDLTCKSLSLCVKNFTQLTELCVWDIPSVDERLLLLITKMLPSLLRLEIGSIPLTEKCAQSIAKLRHLKHLDVCGCTLLSDVKMSYIACLSELRVLDITASNVTDKGMWYISSLKNLRELVMQSCHLVTDVGCSYIQKLSLLEVLDISYSDITNVGLQALKLLPSLKTLKCKHTNISSAGIHLFCDGVTVEWTD